MLSRAALERFGERGLAAGHPFECKEANDGGAEDVDMGKCMEVSN